MHKFYCKPRYMTLKKRRLTCLYYGTTVLLRLLFCTSGNQRGNLFKKQQKHAICRTPRHGTFQILLTEYEWVLISTWGHSSFVSSSLKQSSEVPVSIIGESKDETQVGWSVCILAYSGSNMDDSYWCVQYKPKPNPKPRPRRRNKQWSRPIPGSRPRPWLDLVVPFRF